MKKARYDSPCLVDLNDIKAVGIQCVGPGAFASSAGPCAPNGAADGGCDAGTNADFGCTSGTTAGGGCNVGSTVA